MSAEIYHCHKSGTNSGKIEGQRLNNNEFFWVENFGDEEGRQAFVRVEDDAVEVFYGVFEVVAEYGGEQDAEISDMMPITTLKPGESHTEQLENIQGEESMLMLHVRNVGGTAINPPLN